MDVVEYADFQLKEWNAVFGDEEISQSLYKPSPGDDIDQECDSDNDSIMHRTNDIPSKLRATMDDRDDIFDDDTVENEVISTEKKQST